MPHAKGVVLPLDEVAVAVALVAILDVGSVQKIPFVGGTTPQLVHLGVAIERTIRARDKNAVGAVGAAACVPILLNGIELGVVVGIHLVGEADLLLVIQAVGLRGLG